MHRLALPLLALICGMNLGCAESGRPSTPEALAQAAVANPGQRVESADGIVMQMHRVQSGASATNDGWFQAQSTGNGFSVLLPGPFNDFTQTAPATDGATVSVHTVGTRTNAGAKFSATATTRSDKKKFDRSACDGVAKSFRKDGTLKTQQQADLGDNPGVDLLVGGVDSLARMRIYVVGDTLYQLIAEFPPELQANLAGDIDRFFGSFRLPQ